MPAPEPLVAAFVARFAGTVRHGTIGGWLSGLAVWHALNGAPWQAGKMLEYTKKGAKKVEPPPMPKRPPVTIEHLHALFGSLRLENSFDAAVFAVACVAFWGCRRLGELTIPSRGTFDPDKHVMAAAEVGVRTLPSGVKYAIFHIPWTKTTKHDGADIVLTQNSDPTDPVAALLNHRSINRDVPVGAPMFSFATDQTPEGWAPMTRDWFLQRCNEVWVEAHLGELTGHCFRIGGATELLLRDAYWSRDHAEADSDRRKHRLIPTPGNAIRKRRYWALGHWSPRPPPLVTKVPYTVAPAAADAAAVAVDPAAPPHRTKPVTPEPAAAKV
ncbi:hypothetical protein VTO73DRAFT_9443 [Trametes versicolor]